MSANSSWASGLGFSVTASLIGAGSKLCLRRSFTLLQEASAAAAAATTTTESPSSSVESSSSLTTIVDDDDQCDHCDQCETPETLSENEDEIDDYSDHDPERSMLIQRQQQRDLSTTTTTTSPSSPSLLFLKLQAFSLRALGMFGMMFLGPACNIYALQFASPSILSPVGGGLTLVWIILLSECTIGEKPRPRQILAVICIVIGEVIVALAGDHVNLYSLSIPTMEEEYQESQFRIYVICMALWMILLIGMIKCDTSTNASWRRFAWGVMGGSVTGMQNFVKDALAVVHGLDVLRGSGSGGGGGASIFFNLPYLLHDFPLSLYALCVMAAIMPLAGLGLLMACMKRYDATYSASMFMGSLVISASVMSAVHYHTFDHLTTLQSFIYPLGLMTMLSGTAILATETRLEKTNVVKNTTTTTMKTSSDKGNEESMQKLLLREASQDSTGSSTIGSYGAIEMA